MSYVIPGPPTAFNGTNEELGGDSTTENLNQWYQSGDQAFIILSACLVLLMVPGIAFLYSGLARRKSALSMLWVVMMSFSVIVFQ
ncbi:ammonium permease, partial [Fusarium globosum]